MKNIVLLILLLSAFCSITPLASQNNILKGIIKLKSSGSMPLPEVEVSSFGTKTVVSQSDGSFEITFPNKSPGMRVKLIIRKAGYDVINIEEAENCIIRNDPNDLLVIVMAKEGERDKEALRHYNIMVEYDNKKFEQQSAALEAQIARKDLDDDKIYKLKEQLYGLKEERDDWRRKAEDLAPQMASIDLDRASETVRKAYQLFENGEIEEAIQTMNSEELNANLETALKNKDLAKKILIKTKIDLDKSIEGFMVKARLSVANRQYQIAQQSYMTAYRADNSNMDRTLEVLQFLRESGQQELSIEVLKSTLTQELDTKIRCTLLNKLGSSFSQNKDFSLADSVLTESLRLLDQDQTLPDTDKRLIVLETTLEQSNLYLFTGNKKVHEISQNALTQVEELLKVDSTGYLPTLRKIYGNISIAYQKSGRYKEADSILVKAISIGETMAADNNDYLENLAQQLNNRGILLKRMRQPVEAKKVLSRSLAIVKQLHKEDPIKYKASLANVYLSLGNLYAAVKQLEDARALYDTISNFYEELTLQNPNRFEDALAMAKMNQGNILRDLNEYSDAQFAYLRSLEIRKRWFEKSESRYGNYLSNTYQNMGLLYRKMGAYGKSENAHKLSVQITESTLTAEEKLNSPRLAVLRMDYGNLYQKTKEIRKADSLYSLTAAAYKSQIEAGNNRFKFNLCITLINHANLYSIGLEHYWELSYQNKGKKIIADAKSILAELPPRIQNNFSPTVTNIESTLEKYSIDDVNFYRDLSAQNIIVPDSSILNTQTAIEKQQKLLTSLRELQPTPATKDTLQALKASGLSLLSYIYLTQGRFMEAVQAASEGLYLRSNDPELLSRLSIAQQLLGRRIKRVNSFAIDQELSERCKACFFRDLEHLKRANNKLELSNLRLTFAEE